MSLCLNGSITGLGEHAQLCEAFLPVGHYLCVNKAELQGLPYYEQCLELRKFHMQKKRKINTVLLLSGSNPGTKTFLTRCMRHASSQLKKQVKITRSNRATFFVTIYTNGEGTSQPCGKPLHLSMEENCLFGLIFPGYHYSDSPRRVDDVST